jgi:hypothetical protein
MLPTVEQLTKQLPKAKYKFGKKPHITIQIKPIPISLNNKNILGERKFPSLNKKDLGKKECVKYPVTNIKFPTPYARVIPAKKPQPYARIIPSKKKIENKKISQPNTPIYAKKARPVSEVNPFGIGKVAQVRLDALAAISEF